MDILHVPPGNIVDSYRRVKQLLGEHQKILFEAMARVDNRFLGPLEISQYRQKHNEIERMLQFADMINGFDKACKLFEEVWKQVNQIGGLPGISSDSILDSLTFKTSNPDVNIRITDEFRWAARLNVFLPPDYSMDIILELKSRDWPVIIPEYILEYIISANYAFKQKLYSVTAALLTIAVEATLRDVLSTKGYTFNVHATKVDTYAYTNAEVGVIGDTYTLKLLDEVPKGCLDFLASFGQGISKQVKIRRVITPKNRVDLNIITPDLIDFWSQNTVAQAAQKKVSGLGDALRIAREVEEFLTPAILPIDFDGVITGVRNNLIHLSGNSLDQPLRILNITLRDFLRNDKMVYNLMTRIPFFINEQYIQIRQEGS
ncbi:MAG: hypothetical protein H6Q67_1784 [Firmicutes bacterium]|nr:hypothetical protein [Bacillota bacterium]